MGLGQIFGMMAYGLGTLLALALAVAIVYLFIKDITQKQHTIPVSYTHLTLPTIYSV